MFVFVSRGDCCPFSDVDVLILESHRSCRGSLFSPSLIYFVAGSCSCGWLVGGPCIFQVFSFSSDRLCWTLPKSARSEVTHASLVADYFQRSLCWLRENDDKHTLYVVKGPYFFLLHDFPAITIRDLNKNPEKISRLIAEGIYGRVILLDVEYFSPDMNRWMQPYPLMPKSKNLVTRRIDGWRGFIHGEAIVEEVLGVKDDAGRFVPLGMNLGGPADFKPNDEDFFNYIRSLHP